MEQIDRSTANAIRLVAQTVQEYSLPRMFESACEHHLSRNQVMTLNLLRSGRGISVSEIARVLEVTPPAASKIVERLTSLGYARRRARHGDRRVSEVVIGDGGRALLEQFAELTDLHNERTLAHFTAEEKRLLAELLHRYLRIALADLPQTEPLCLQCFDRRDEECLLAESAENCLVATA